MNLLYNTAIGLYSFGARLVSYRNAKARKMIDGQKKTMDYLRRVIAKESRYIWIHVASLGEFEQARPLIEKIKKEYPKEKLLLTFFSPSGYEVRKNYAEVDAVCYLPFDFKRNAKRLLDIVNPKMAIFVKYEFWGNYLQELHRRQIPTYLISAIFRPKQSFFQWWGGMFRQMLACYTHLYVQDDASKELLASIGVRNVTVAGDTRFDRVTQIMSGTMSLPLIDMFKYKARLTMIAGSSWGADEDVYLPWFNSQKGNVKLIIAPHEFDEERLEYLQKRIPSSMLWSKFQKVYSDPSDGSCGAVNPDLVKCLIIDCFGLLASLYRYGDVAYVGGGFGAGIHNINEAAVYGMPVIFGPKYQKFKEAHDLIEAGGAFSVSGREEFETVMSRLENGSELEKAGEKAGSYIKRNLGATDKIFADLFQ